VRLFFDTSILVAALVDGHPAHGRALVWLQRVRSGTDIGIISAHTLAELYSILTTLPIHPRITPSTARQLIADNLLGTFEIVTLSEGDYAAVLDHLMALGITGGATYDALILHAASKASPDQILTLNERDFRRVYPSLSDKLLTP
jgi:predicted nucleic acid-binding protein